MSDRERHPTAPLTDERLAAIRARAEAANTMVDRLCLPKSNPNHRRWMMSIPARPERDPDLVIGDALDDIPALLDEVARLRAANAALTDTLQWLHDLQTGPPLIRDERQWNETMARAAALLRDPDAVGARYAAVVEAARAQQGAWNAYVMARRRTPEEYTVAAYAPVLTGIYNEFDAAKRRLHDALDALDGGAGEAAGDA